MSLFRKNKTPPEAKLVLAWLCPDGLTHHLPLAVLPPVRTALQWQQVFEYRLGYATWIES